MSNTAYPGAIDSFTDPNNSTDTMASVPHNIQHGQANDAATALETKLGTGASTPTNAGVAPTFLMGTGVGASGWVASPTNPSFTTGILDSNGKQWLGQTPTTNAVDYVNITNAATGGTPAIGSAGSDGNIDLNITSKGSGKVRENGSSMLDFRASFANFIQSGGIWTQNSGLVGSMTAATLWINGIEYSQVAVSNHTFGTSVDTYVDYTVGTGITYTAVANNAASPSLAANSVRITKVVTSGAAITSIVQTGWDSIGNSFYNTSSSILGSLGYAQITSNTTVASNTPTQIAGLTSAVIIPAGSRKIRITAYIPNTSNVVVCTAAYSIWDGAVNSGTQLAASKYTHPLASGTNTSLVVMAVVSPAPGSKTYNVGAQVDTGTETNIATSTAPPFILVEAI